MQSNAIRTVHNEHWIAAKPRRTTKPSQGAHTANKCKPVHLYLPEQCRQMPQ
jgi:hypothetical protein